MTFSVRTRLLKLFASSFSSPEEPDQLRNHSVATEPRGETPRTFPTLVPYLALAIGVIAAIALPLSMSTGYDGRTKWLQILFQTLFVLPPLIWVLREKATTAHVPSKLPVAPFFFLYAVAVLPICWIVRHGIYNGDESAYIFQAKIFSSLRPYTDALPDGIHPEFTFIYHLMYNGHWFGKYPPGWPALLSLLSWVIPAWLVTPVLGATILWLVYVIAKSLYGDRVASVAVALMACSTSFLLTCVGFMSHVACGLFLAIAAAALAKAFETRRTRDYALMFAALAAAFLVRPFTAACMGMVLGLTLLWSLRDDWGPQAWLRLVKVSALGVGIVAIGVAALFYDNHVLTGHFWLSPYALYLRTDVPKELQFSLHNMFTYAVTQTPVSLARTALHGFPFALLLAAYAVIQERSRRSLLLLGLVLSLVVGYMATLVTRTDSLVGERYFFEAYFAVVILAAAGWENLRNKWNPSPRAVKAAILGATCLAIYYYADVARASVELRQGYAAVNEAGQRLPSDRALVFMKRSKSFNPYNFNPNSPQWQTTRVLFAIDPGEEKRAAVASLLERPVWAVMSYDPQTRQAVIEEQSGVR